MSSKQTNSFDFLDNPLERCFGVGVWIWGVGPTSFEHRCRGPSRLVMSFYFPLFFFLRRGPNKRPLSNFRDHLVLGSTIHKRERFSTSTTPRFHVKFETAPLCSILRQYSTRQRQLGNRASGRKGHQVPLESGSQTQALDATFLIFGNFRLRAVLVIRKERWLSQTFGVIRWTLY